MFALLFVYLDSRETETLERQLNPALCVVQTYFRKHFSVRIEKLHKMAFIIVFLFF